MLRGTKVPGTTDTFFPISRRAEGRNGGRVWAGPSTTTSCTLRPDGAALLWRDIPADSSPAAMQRAFEGFCDSCDWWLDRVRELDEPADDIPPMMIRP